MDRRHQVEDGAAHHGLVGAAGDEARMRHVAAGQGRQDALLAPHHVVAGGPQMLRPAAQDVVATAAREAHEHVLRAAGERLTCSIAPAGSPCSSIHRARTSKSTNARSMP